MATLLTQQYNLNLIPGQNIVVVNAAAYDNSPRLIRFNMFNGAVAADISGWSARVEGTRQGTKAGFSTVCTVASPVVSFAITDAMTASSGKHQAAVVFYQGEERVASATFILNVAPAVLDESTPATEEDATIYQQWLAANTSQIQANANEISVLKGRMDEFASLPPGSTEGNAELVDIRVGYDGTTYPTAGDAVRNQVTDLKSQLNEMLTIGDAIEIATAQGNIIHTTGQAEGSSGTLYNQRVRTGYIQLDAFGVYVEMQTNLMVGVYYYEDDSAYLGYDVRAQKSIITNSGYPSATKVRLVFSYVDNANITPSGITDTYVYKRVLTDTTLTKSGKAADAKVMGDMFDRLEIVSVNMFNKDAVDNITGKTLNKNTGNIASGSSYGVSEYIDIDGLNSVTSSYCIVLCFYDDTKTFISESGKQYSNYQNVDYTTTVPADAKYARISYPLNAIDSVQFGESVSRLNYVAYNESVYIDNLIVKNTQVVGEDPLIVVAPSGGNYTSLTRAVYENRDTGAPIVVKPGTYDIVAEYVNLFGQDVVDSLADSTDINGFQYGIRLRNRKITFESGSHVICDWTGHAVNGTHRFSAFSVAMNAEIEGLDLDCTATFYAIHDDYGYTAQYYHNIYKDCRIIGHNITNQNLIGGGCKPYSKHTIKNCYFDNGTTSGACVRYHNTNLADAEPVIYVSDSYFGQGLSFRYYGSQTTKMRAYVNNCKAAYINKGAEGAATVDNVELYQWSNEVG